jgi:L-idonate 5-dehydrogenase
MRAAILHAPHDLRIEDVETPAVGANDVRVRIRAGGICGSDLHYFQDGGFGAIRLRQPMILGHEIAGTIEAIGPAVTGLAPGDLVAVNPSLPCGQCRYCRAGQSNHCLDMRFYGSAMRMPHIQGGFREKLVCDASQAIALPDGASVADAAFAEPLAVCLHAAGQAGDLLGRRVLITGAGPIGALCVLVARAAGAAEIVATDLADAPLALVGRLGADHTINVAAQGDALRPYAADKGQFDVVLEASGANPALRGALDIVRPGGVIVQIGIGADMTLPMNVLVAKEIQLRGSFRFIGEFAQAVHFIAAGRIDVRPLLTDTIPLAEAPRAFALAADRSRSMKVQLAF